MATIHELDKGSFGRFLAQLRRETCNLVLIGMPGSGKSTIGALLAGVFFYWVLKKEDCLVQVNLARRRPLGRWFYPTAKYLYCGVTVLVLILGAVNGGIG